MSQSNILSNQIPVIKKSKHRRMTNNLYTKRDFECDQCDKRYGSLGALSYHIGMKHNGLNKHIRNREDLTVCTLRTTY